jgi:hypothetical protein
MRLGAALSLSTYGTRLRGQIWSILNQLAGVIGGEACGQYLPIGGIGVRCRPRRPGVTDEALHPSRTLHGWHGI